MRKLTSSPLLGCFIVAARAAAAEEGLLVLDGQSLVQGDVQVQRFDRFKAVVLEAGQKLGRHLQKYEASLEEQQEVLANIKYYMSKLEASFGKSGTMFSMLSGILPVGNLDEQDRKAATIMVSLLREPSIVDAIALALDDLNRAIKIYSQRTDRLVTDLVVQSTNVSEGDLPGLINKLFVVEQHVMTGLINRVTTKLAAVFYALPQNYSVVGGFARQTISRLVNYTISTLAEHVQLITDTNGTKFCSDFSPAFKEQALPVAAATLGALPGAERFAEVNTPDVLPEVRKLMKMLTGIATTLVASMEKESVAWMDKLCGIVSLSAESAASES